MKRSAAIIGPTPAFLRWALVVPCPFRDPDAKRPADAAFRDLRSLRAIAVAEFEGRIFDGICVHPNATEVKIAEAKGFPVGEVYAAYGGSEPANSTCQNCVANVPVCHDELDSACDSDVEFSKAGCFGWVPFGDNLEGSSGFSQLMESGESELLGIVEAFESAVNSAADNPFPSTDPAWYGIWNCGEYSHQQLEFLNHVCAKVQSPAIAWQRLARAVQVAHEHDLRFVCALTPPGHSDGANWAMDSFCASCGFARTNSPCTACQDRSAPRPSRKTKVLGLRPYLNLVSIIGEEATVAIVDRYRESKNDS